MFGWNNTTMNPMCQRTFWILAIVTLLFFIVMKTLQTRQDAHLHTLSDTTYSAPRHKQVLWNETQSAPALQIYTNQGTWKETTYVLQKNERDCQSFVATFLQNPFNLHPSWIFIGDSTMGKMVAELLHLHSSNTCKVLKQCNITCTLEEYINMGGGKIDQTVEIASMFEFKYSACNNDVRFGDRACHSALFTCDDKSIEYLQNWNLNTKRLDLIYSYLKHQRRDVCVVNSGMHDMSRLPNSAELFSKNVQRHLSALNYGCKKLLWVSINAVLGEAKYRQSNEKIERWNSMVLQMMKNNVSNAAYIDVYAMSLPASLHADNVHMNATYYKQLARCFI